MRVLWLVVLALLVDLEVLLGLGVLCVLLCCAECVCFASEGGFALSHFPIGVDVVLVVGLDVVLVVGLVVLVPRDGGKQITSGVVDGVVDCLGFTVMQ